MKIVVTTLQSKKGDTHQIDVVDGQRVLHTQTVTTVEQRDEVVWGLAELYRVVDIDIKTAKKKKKSTDNFKFSEIPSIPVLESEDAEFFFDDESTFVFYRIVESITEGLHLNLKEVRLFELNGSGEYFTAERRHWESGLQIALDYYVSIEDYTKCIEVRDLIKKL
tara:strand:- start:657 stop:1151 length:495 start_codon:yes stop_codon:yes gene_type:complete